MCLFKILQSDKDNVFLWTKQWADLPTASFIKLGLPSFHGSEIKNPPPNAGAASLISGSGRSPGRENGNSPQYFCWDNPMERGAWWAKVHGVSKSRTWLSTQRLIKYQDSSPAILSTVCIGSNKIPSFQSWGIRGWVTDTTVLLWLLLLLWVINCLLSLTLDTHLFCQNIYWQENTKER